jgi:hypothetical protein
MSSRRRRNLLRTLAILVALVVALAGAGAVYGYRYADRLPPVGLPGGKGVSLATTAVTVLNGSGALGAAARAATDLRRLGVRVVATGNAPRPIGATPVLTVGSGFRLDQPRPNG